MIRKFTSVELIGMYVTLVLAKVVFGYFSGEGLFASMYFLPVLTAIVCYSNPLTKKYISLPVLLSVLYTLHAVGIYFFAAGTRDDAGRAWMMLLTLCGYSFSLIIFALWPLAKGEKWKHKLLSILILLIGMLLSVLIFNVD